MALPPALGVESYNGVTFDASARTKVVQTPVMTQDGRTVSYFNYLITVAGYVTTGPAVTSTDATLDSWRDALGASAGELRLTSVGYGTFVINPAAGIGTRDVKWGPVPKVLSWQPLGGAKAARVEWQVEVHIPCSDAETTSGTLMEATYSLRVSKDYAGLSTRTLTGYARIAITRFSATSRVLLDTVDRYKERLYPAVPPHFRRVQDDWDLSQDKAEVTWNVTDEELPGPNVPPPGAVQVEANHQVRSTSAGLIRWTGVVSATYEMATDAHRGQAFDLFIELLTRRMRYAKGNAFIDVPGQARPTKGFAWLIALEVGEPEVYGRNKATFAGTYMLTTGFNFLVGGSGLWTPVPNSDDKLYKVALDKTAWTPRGSAGLKFRPSDDAIVSLCVNKAQTPTLKPGAPPITGRLRPGKLETLRPPVPDPLSSWLWFENVIGLEWIDGITVHTPIPTTPIKPDTPGSGERGIPDKNEQPLFIGAAGPTARGGDLFRPLKSQARFTSVSGPPAVVGNVEAPAPPYTPGEGGKSIVQYRGRPRFYVTMRGFAMRLCYRIPLPQLIQIGNALAVPANREGNGFWVYNQEMLGGLQVFRMEWNLRYAVIETPGPLPVPWNPLYGFGF